MELLKPGGSGGQEKCTVEKIKLGSVGIEPWQLEQE